MDFHVWAKLDNGGRIQSVQSSCTQSPQTHSPVWPVMSADQRDDGLIQQDKENSEKVVPYMEKKDLVYKLDAKVDEMSIIVRQLADFSERNKLQNKLINQYEEKIASQEKKIKSLEEENAKLKFEQTSSGRIHSDGSMTIPKCFKSSHLDVKMVCNLDDSGKCSSWPIDSISTKEMTNRRNDGAHAEPVDEVVVVQRLEIDNFVDIRDTVGKSTVLPSSLCLGIDISSSSSGTDLDVEGHFNFRRRNSSTRNGYSYVEKQTSLVLPSEEKHQDKEQAVRSNIVEKETEITNERTTNVHHSPMVHVDKHGYLGMRYSPIMFLDDSVISRSKENWNVQSQKGENYLMEEERKSCVENEAVHSSWLDIINGHYISENDSSRIDGENLTQKYLTTDEYLDPKVCASDYIEITIDNVPIRPPRPLPRQQSSSCNFLRQSSNSRDIPQPRSDNTISSGSDKREIFDRQWSSASSSTSQSSDHSAVSVTCDTHTSLPASYMSSSQKESSYKDDRRAATLATTHSADSFSTYPTDSSDYLRPRPQISFDSPSASLPSDQNAAIPKYTATQRLPNTDTRKDDHLNTVLKDMRTTMEWHMAKRKLISQSHHSTADQVELKLRSVVQDMYQAYSLVQIEKSPRLKRYSNDRLMKKIQDRIGKTHTDHCLSEEFMKKCLDLVMFSCQVQFA